MYQWFTHNTLGLQPSILGGSKRGGSVFASIRT